MILQFPKKRVFFYHYNKPASQRAGHAIMSVHVANTCHFVRAVVCGVPCYSAERKTQPRMVMKGLCSEIEITDTLITIR